MGEGLQSRGLILRLEVCNERVHGGQGLGELGGIWTARVGHDARMHGTRKLLQQLRTALDPCGDVLASRGVKVPDAVGKGQTGNKNFNITDPDGHIVELATAGPGFTVDEDVVNLGTNLKLPPWLEKHRADIEAHLKLITVPEWEIERA